MSTFEIYVHEVPNNSKRIQHLKDLFYRFDICGKILVEGQGGHDLSAAVAETEGRETLQTVRASGDGAFCVAVKPGVYVVKVRIGCIMYNVNCSVETNYAENCAWFRFLMHCKSISVHIPPTLFVISEEANY